MTKPASPIKISQPGEIWIERPRQLKARGKTYDYLAKGTFNAAYLSKNKNNVLKVPHYDSAQYPTEAPERAVRLWNALSPTKYATAETSADEGRIFGWTAPFIKGTTPSTAEICNFLIEFYQRTGRIIVDAYITKNFVKTLRGEIVCIDCNLALLLQKKASMGSRKPSETSLEAWFGRKNSGVDEESSNGAAYDKEFTSILTSNVESYQPLKPIVRTIQALLYIEKHSLGNNVVEKLKQDDWTETLSRLYTKKRTPDEVIIKLDHETISKKKPCPSEMQKELMHEQKKEPEQLKKEQEQLNDLKKALCQRIDAYTIIAHDGIIGGFFSTAKFRNNKITSQKLQEAETLKNEINKKTTNACLIETLLLDSIDANLALEKEAHPDRQNRSCFFQPKSRYAICLTECQKIIANMPQLR